MRKGIVFLAAGMLALAASKQNPVVTTREGKLAGLPGKDASIIAFKGIPYAAPPVGSLRWRPPQPAAAWSGVHEASSFGKSCIQNIVPERKPWTSEFMTHNEVSEDCLYLNIWTQAGFPGKKRPVFFFIHGGGFTEGSGAVPVYDGEGLASKGLVVVTINYRLGVFGFFTHPELTRESAKHASGDYGLLDQVAALRWVHENIAQFGGDPGLVTIAGQSAGASSVNALIASPLARDLFARAIAESGLRSGQGGRGMKTLPQQEQDGVRFAESKGLHTLDELRRATPEQLRAGPQVRFGVVVDGYLLPEPIEQIFTEGQQNDVPTITGWNKDDLGIVSNPKTTVDTFHRRAIQRYGKLAEEFLTVYPAANDEEAREAETEASRDELRAAAYLWAVKRAKSSQTYAYTYYWNHALPGPDAGRFGAFHSSELPYVLNTLSMCDRPVKPGDFQIAKMVSQYWANFAAKGDPNGKGLATWPPVQKGNAETMQIGDDPGVISIAGNAEKLAFWNHYLDAALHDGTQ